MKMRELREHPACVSALMMLLYAFSNGIQYIGYNHIPLFISSQSFANDSTIGYATAIGSVATIVAQLFWGRIADRSRSKNRVLAIALLGMSLSALFFWQDMPSARFLYMAMPIFYFFFLAPQSMSDTICIENIEKTGRPFTFIRSAAPICSTLLALLMFLVPTISVKTMIVIYTICPLIAIAPALLLPKTEGHNRAGSAQKSGSGSMLALLKICACCSSWPSAFWASPSATSPPPTSPSITARPGASMPAPACWACSSPSPLLSSPAS